MGLLEVIVSLSSGESALLPLRNAASIILRDDAFGPNAAMIAFIGTIIHFSIAVIYGFAYGVLNSQIP